jgi:hypothetical protein
MSNHHQMMPVDLAREIARQAETRLMAIMALATAADARATMLCGIFGAASVGLGAAVLTYLGTDHPAARLIASGTVTAVLFLAAAIIAAFAGAPRDFWLAGGMPKALRDWAWEGTRWRSEAEMLDGTAQRLADAIDLDRRLLERESRLVNSSLWVAAAAVILGLTAYFLIPCFS